MIAQLALALCLQADESAAVSEAVKATLAKKSWSVQITPATEIKDTIPKDQAATAGAPITCAIQEDGTYKIASGAGVLFGRGENAVTRAGDKWQPVDDVCKAELQTFMEEVGWNRWGAGNVTAGKDALTRYLALEHLRAVGMPPGQLLAQIEADLPELKKAGNDTVDGKTCTIYEGELSSKAATRIASGPFARLADAKLLTVSEPAGRGRIWVASDGIIRGVTYKVGAKYTVREISSGRKKTAPVSYEIALRFTKFDQTTVSVPKDVEEALRTPPK